VRAIPFVDSDGVVLWESYDEHEVRELLRTGRYVPVWGQRRIVALQYTKPEREELMARKGNCWSPLRYSDGAYSLAAIPDEYKPFFTPRWKSTFRQAMRPSVFLPEPAAARVSDVPSESLQKTSAPDWLLRSFAAYSRNTAKSSACDTSTD
jgi:hypothetical protein